MADAVSRDWACLPRDVADLILEKVEVDFHDFVRFASVCKPWRSTALATDSIRHIQSRLRFHLLKTCRNVLPMLMIATSDDCGDHRSLYSVTDEQIHRLQLPISCSKRFVGSSQGWLFMVDDSKIMTLINPFLKKTIVLPNLQFNVETDDNLGYEYFIRKAILVFDQEREKYGVLLIYSLDGKLAYWKPEANDWETITAGCHNLHFEDIICYKGQTYGVTDEDGLVQVDVTTGRCRTAILRSDLDDEVSTRYLVESQEGDLLLVKRLMNHFDVAMCEEYRVREASAKDGDKLMANITESFEVYKLSLHATAFVWVEINSIGEQALFLGDNHSLSISSREFPNFQSNSIYYVNDYFDIHYCYIPPRDFEDDNGIYNMENRTITRHYTPHSSVLPLLPAIWVVPTFKSFI